MQAKALVPIAAGAALVLLGVVLGTWIGASGSPALAATTEPYPQMDLLEEVRSMQEQLATLTDEVRALRGERGRRSTSLATGLEHVPIAAADPAPSRAPIPSSTGSEEENGREPVDTSVAEALQ